MAQSITFNGLVYSIPDVGDESWGENLTSYFTAIPQGALQKTGGAFTLTAEVNFGATYGLVSTYFKSRTANASSAGALRLAVTDSIAWRNNANSGNLLLSVDGSDHLTFNGASLPTGGITALTGDVTATGPGSVAATIAANAVTSAKFRQSAALSVVGNATNATANVTDIAAGTDHMAFVRSGTTLTWALLVNANLSGSAAITNANLNVMASASTTVGTVKGNISGSSAVPSDLVLTSANTISSVVYRDGSGNFAAGTITASLTGSASGNLSYSANQYGVLFSGAANVVTVLAPDASTAKVLISGGSSANPAWGLLTNTNLSGSAAIANANLAAMAANTVKANVTGGSAVPTDVAAVSAATASAFVVRDANANAALNNHLDGYTTTATAAGTTTLTVASSRLQYFTGATTQIIALPVTSTLVLGQSFDIVNLSSGALTVNSSGGNLVATVGANLGVTVTCILTSGTAAASWSSVSSSGSPLTTKGDLYSFSTLNARLPVGVDGQFLMPDSNQTLGLRYANVPFPNQLQINSDAEVSVGQWAAFANSAANIPTSGTGGSPASTITRTTSSPLSGTGSFLWTKSANNRQGEGAACPFSVPLGYRGQVLNYNMLFNVASGAFTASDGVTAPKNDGTTTTTAGNSDLEIFFYDVTNSVLLYPTPSVIISNSTVGFIVSGTIQLPSNSTSYRIIVYQALAGVVAYTAQFDDVYIGLQPAKSGPPMTSWSTTPSLTYTALGTVTNENTQSQRIGDSLIFRGSLTLGTTTGSTMSINMPSGYTIDSSKLSTRANHQIVGYAYTMRNANAYAATNSGPWPLFYDGSTTNAIFMAATATTDSMTKAAGTAALNGSDGFTFDFTVPIAGWSANTAMSSDASSRVIVAKYGASTTTMSTSDTIINFNTLIDDNTASVTTGASWKFTAPVSGYYQVDCNVVFPSQTWVAADVARITVYKNNSVSTTIGNAYAAAGYTGRAGVSGSTEIQLVAGEFIDIRGAQKATSALDLGVQYINVSIKQIQGPSNIAVVDSYNAGYYNSSTTVSSSLATIVWTTKDFDSANAMSSGLYTIPISGKWQVNCLITIAGTYALNGNLDIQIQKNSTLHGASELVVRSGGAENEMSGFISNIVPCVAGDVIRIQASASASGPTLTSGRNFFSISRVGN